MRGQSLKVTKDELSGDENTGSVNLRTNEPTTMPIEIISEKLSTEREITEIQSEGLQRPSLSLNEETSTTINLLRSTANELHGLMKGLNKRSEWSQNEFQALDSDRVRVAAECGKQIIAAMRMQLDVLKFAKEMGNK